MQTTNLTSGKIEGGVRIDSCCWLDGMDDQYIIEFWWLNGSFLRREYDRRSTMCEESFVPVRSEAFDMMMAIIKRDGII